MSGFEEIERSDFEDRTQLQIRARQGWLLLIAEYALSLRFANHLDLQQIVTQIIDRTEASATSDDIIYTGELLMICYEITEQLKPFKGRNSVGKLLGLIDLIAERCVNVNVKR